MNDIAVDLSYKGQQFIAKVHFNRIKMSNTIKDSDLDIFCQKLAEELRSTSNKVSPLPGKSSDATSQFDPSSVSIHHNNIHPISKSYIGQIQVVISEFVNEKVEFARLFAEAMDPAN